MKPSSRRGGLKELLLTHPIGIASKICIKLIPCYENGIKEPKQRCRLSDTEHHAVFDSYIAFKMSLGIPPSIVKKPTEEGSNDAVAEVPDSGNLDS